MSAQTTNNNSVWAKVVELAKDHHRSVNAAHSALYNNGRATSGATSRNSSIQSNTDSLASVHPSLRYRKASSVLSHDLPSQSTLSSSASMASDKPLSQSSKHSQGKAMFNKAWSEVKKAAREHHEGVNAAYHAHYGMGTSR
jgi:hypothetical protein